MLHSSPWASRFQLLGARFPVALWLSPFSTGAADRMDCRPELDPGAHRPGQGRRNRGHERCPAARAGEGEWKALRLEAPGRSASINVLGGPAGIVVLNFSGDWHQNKLRLARAYLAKQ